MSGAGCAYSLGATCSCLIVPSGPYSPSTPSGCSTSRRTTTRARRCGSRASKSFRKAANISRDGEREDRRGLGELAESAYWRVSQCVLIDGLLMPLCLHTGDENPSQEAPAEKPDPERMYGVLLRTRSLLQFLSAHVVSTTTIACGRSILRSIAWR